MNIYVAVPLFLAVAIFQSTVIPHLTVAGVFADIPMLVVASWSLLRGSQVGILSGFLAGLALDLFSGAPFGTATMALMAVGALTGMAQRGSIRARLVLPLAVAFLGTLVYSLVFLILVGISAPTVASWDSFVRIVLPSAVLNTAVMPFVYVGALGLHRWSMRHDAEFLVD